MKLNIRIESGLKQVMMMTYQSSSLAVEITKLINKRELVNSDGVFDIMIRYLEFVGKYDVYYTSISAIFDDVIMMNDAEITEELNNILEIFNSDSIEAFLTNSNYASPSNLIDEFHNDIIKNREGSREQTYTKKDYRNLVVTVIKLKALSIIIARFVAIHNINVNSAEAVRLFRIINNMSNLNKEPGYLKLIDYINMCLSNDESVTQEDISRILTKSITNNQFSQYIALNILIYLGVASTPDRDTHARCLINEVFRLCRNKMASASTFIINDPSITIDDEGGNSGVTDMYLSVTEVALGTVEEWLLVYETVELILQQMTIPVELMYIEEAYKFKDLIKDKPLNKVQSALIAWIFVDVIESEYLDYFEKTHGDDSTDILLNFRIIAYAMLKTYELENLANVMMGVPYGNSDYLSKSSSNLASDDLEEQLNSMYSLSINKKSKTRKYGLSILDDADVSNDDNSLSQLLIKPVCRFITTTKWLCYNLDKSNNIISISNIRDEVIKLQTIIYKFM